MMIKLSFTRSNMQIFLTALLLNLAGLSYSYSAELFCFETLASKDDLGLKIESVFNPLDSNVLTFKAYVNKNQEAGYLEARFQNESVHIAHIRVNEAYRNQGVSKALLKTLIGKTGTQGIYSIYLIDTNREVFVKTFSSLSRKGSLLYRPDLSLSARQLAAIKSTPAYKAQDASGIGKILKYEIANCTETECLNPIIYYHTTGK